MNDTITTLLDRNRQFVQHQMGTPPAAMMPALKTIVIGCADPRVDPAHVLGLASGDALVIRNIGGRVTPATIQTIGMLGMIAKAGGGTPGLGWNLVVLHHTSCGITRLAGQPDALAAMFGTDAADVVGKAVADPHVAVAVDVAVLHANPMMPADFQVSGLVYDVTTGQVDVVVDPEALRSDAGEA